MPLIYNVFANISVLVLRVLALFNSKLKRAIEVRKDWDQQLQNWQKSRTSNKPVLCLHCASLGEYEMIVPLISRADIQEKYDVVLSFFSPSGYENLKVESHVSGKFYLPFDTARNAKNFVELLKPSVFVFVKYELWHNLIGALQQQNVKLLLVNALIRERQFLTSLAGKSLLKKLQKFDSIFVQNSESYNRLSELGFANVEVINDLRYDRVAQIKTRAINIPQVESFKGDDLTLIAGSSWPEEESILADFLASTDQKVKLIVAPHDVGEDHVKEIESKFKSFRVQRYTEYDEALPSDVLIINTIGLLSSVYRYGDLAFIGGAFNKGLHNVLEAVSFGLPVITGPKTSKFPEVSLLIEEGILIKVSDSNDFMQVAERMLGEPRDLLHVAQLAEKWLDTHTGGTDVIARQLV
ncbi:MAG: hypothetical protein JJ975_02045 [Bacteroidia bacterium]|nr:hypothetical protein [Bacteroidia bacterium]